MNTHTAFRFKIFSAFSVRVRQTILSAYPQLIIRTPWPLVAPSLGKVKKTRAILMPVIDVYCGMVLAAQTSAASSPKVYVLLPQKLQ